MMDIARFKVKLKVQEKRSFLEEVIFHGEKKSKKKLFIVRIRTFHAEKGLANDPRKVTSFS